MVFKNNSTSYQYTSICILILLNIFSAYPSTIPLLLPIPNVKVMTFGYILLYSIFLLSFRKVWQVPSIIFQLMVIQLIGWLILYMVHLDGVYITRITYLVNAYLAILCLYQYKNGINKFINKYDVVIAVMSVLGTIAFFLVFFNLLSPVSTYTNVDSRIGYFYGLTCTNTIFINVIRYAGFFDEPGAMAAWGMYALLLNQLIINSKKMERILLICLSFTFSVAYYIQVILYILFFKIKKTKHLLICLLIIAASCFTIIELKDSNEALYNLTLGRLELNDKGTIKGDTRSSLSSIAKNYFKKSPLVGNGPTYIQKVDYMGDNPFETLASDGLIGSVIMYLPLLMLLISSKKNIISAVIILMVGYMQRPFHTHFIHFLMMYLFVIAVVINLHKHDELRIAKSHHNYNLV